MKITRRVLAGLLAFLTAAFAPGLASYQAAAQVINGGSAAAGTSRAIAVVPRGAALPGAGLAPLSPDGILFPFIGAPSFVVPTPVRGPSLQSVAAVAAAIPSLPVSVLAARPTTGAAAPIARAVPAGRYEGALAAPDAKTSLALAGDRLFAADEIEKTGVLDALFTGARRIYVAGADAVSAGAALERRSGGALGASVASARFGAAPPRPVVLEGRGLHPGERFLSVPAGGDAPSAPASFSSEKMDAKAVAGLFAQRTVSIVAFVLTSIAYPFVAIPAVGAASFGALMALGPLAAIATGPLNGLIADRMSARNGLALMGGLRAVMALALPAFAAFGALNFATLLLASIANGWLLSSLMISEGTYIRRLAGAKNVPVVNGLAAINYLTLQVLLGLVIGVGTYVDRWSPMLPFYISFALHAFVVVPIIWKMIPNIQPVLGKAAESARGFAGAARAKIGAALDFLRRYWKEAALLAVAVAAYLAWSSPLPISAALIWWISRGGDFQKVWAQKSLRAAMLLSALAAALLFPFQYLVLPLMALSLGGAAGKGLILGQLIGAFFFGQLAANASQTKLPEITLPLVGKVGAARVLQAGVLALAAIWAGMRLFPGSLLAAAVAAAAGAALLWGGSRLSARGWIKYLGAGLACVFLPLVFWGSLPALFSSVLMIGLFSGPSMVALSSYFQTHAKGSSLGSANGVNASVFNSAVSFGYGFMTLITSMFSPTFPAALLPIGLAFLAAGAVFFLAPKRLPGLPAASLSDPAEPKKV